MIINWTNFSNSLKDYLDVQNGLPESRQADVFLGEVKSSIDVWRFIVKDYLLSSSGIGFQFLTMKYESLTQMARTFDLLRLSVENYVGIEGIHLDK